MRWQVHKMLRKDRINVIIKDIIEMEKRRNEQALGQLYALLKKENQKNNAFDEDLGDDCF